MEIETAIETEITVIKKDNRAKVAAVTVAAEAKARKKGKEETNHPLLQEADSSLESPNINNYPYKKFKIFADNICFTERIKNKD